MKKESNRGQHGDTRARRTKESNEGMQRATKIYRERATEGNREQGEQQKGYRGVLESKESYRANTKQGD